MICSRIQKYYVHSAILSKKNVQSLCIPPMTKIIQLKKSQCVYISQATMLKKIKSKRRLTEPHISPAVAGSSGAPENNGDRDKEPLSGT